MRLTLKERIENCHEDAVWTATWTPADTLISGSVDETVKVWAPAESNESQHTYTGRGLIDCEEYRKYTKAGPAATLFLMLRFFICNLARQMA